MLGNFQERQNRLSGVTRLAGLASALFLFTAAACVDTEPPQWWDGKKAGQTTSENGLTAMVEGQACTADQLSPPSDALRVHFIDVGQGDAIWVQTPTGQNVLIDAGDGGFFGRTRGGDYVLDYLSRHGLPTGSALDTVVISHAHSDHFGGLSRVFSNYHVASFADPGHEAETLSYQDVLAEAATKVPPSAFWRPAMGAGGIAADFGGRMDIFGPDVDAWLLNSGSALRLGSDQGSRVNNTSLVMRLHYAGRSIMLMADAEAEVEHELILRYVAATQEPKLDANILKVGHHGSLTASTGSFLDATFRSVPQEDRYAIITSGRLPFSGQQLPASSTIYSLWERVSRANLFSTEAGDDLKAESTAPGDDDILAVIEANGKLTVCYEPK